MPESLRAFIAFDLPESIVSSLARVQEGLKSYGFQIKWVRPENIHLTLKFLGSTPRADIAKIFEAMSDAVKGYGPLSLAAKGIGVFPDAKRPRVIWTGLSGQLELLMDFQRTLDRYLATLGFPQETRPFTGHLTLGRVKGKIASAKMMKAMQKFAGFESEFCVLNQITLFKSDLKPTGAFYSKIKIVSL